MQVIAHVWEWVLSHEHISYCYEPSGELKSHAFASLEAAPASPRKDLTAKGRSEPAQRVSPVGRPLGSPVGRRIHP